MGSVHNTSRSFWLTSTLLLLFTLAFVYISVTNGTFDMSVGQVFRTLLRIDRINEYDLVIFDFRLPRIVLGMLVGLGLGIAGAVIQGITRNGLADPGMLGVNAGASASVVLFMFMFEGSTKNPNWLSVMAMPMFGMVGGLLAIIIIYYFAQDKGKLDPQRLILVGIAVGSGFSAFTLFLSLKMNPQDFERAAVWLAGSVHNANWRFVAAMLPWLVICIPFIWCKSYILDLLQLNEESATGLGVGVHKQRRLLLFASVGLVSACVSVAGSISFVGLIAPHIARRLIGEKHRFSIPICGLIGMAMVVLSDFIGKTLFAPAQLAAGIVISIVGVPYFVYLLFRK